MKRRQLMLAAFLVFIALAMLAGLIAIVLPDRYVNDDVILTILTVGIYALGGLMVVAVGREMPVTRRGALASAIISLIAFITLIWFENSMRHNLEENVFKLAFSTLIISLACTHRLLIVPLEGRNTWGHLSKRVALISAAVTALVFIVLMVYEGLWGWEDLMVRILGVGLLVTAGSSICAGAIALFGPRPGEDEPDAVADSLTLTLSCPVCANRLDLRSNRDGHCGHCNLQIHVKTSELRCACGYLLHQLESEICPECGKPVDAGERWVDAEPT